jgi:FkbM family methyltransferase
MTRGTLLKQIIPASVGRLAIKSLLRLQPHHERRLLQVGRHFVPSMPIIARTAAGFQMELDLEDKIERRIYYTGMYEHVLDTILRHALPQCRAFVDIGANCGYVSLLAAAMLAERGAVYAFEPFPATFRRLKRNLELNPGLRNVTPYQVALGNTSGTCTLHARPGNLGSTSMAALSESADGVDVRCDRLDDLARNLDLQTAFVKIDVEGAELMVLEGMTALLAKHACTSILVEMHPTQIRELGGRPEDVPKLLERHGYRLLTSSGDALVDFEYRDFFGSDQGHRFIFATLSGDWAGFKVPAGF